MGSGFGSIFSIIDSESDELEFDELEFDELELEDEELEGAEGLLSKLHQD